jgi:hypothetical protein
VAIYAVLTNIVWLAFLITIKKNMSENRAEQSDNTKLNHK